MYIVELSQGIWLSTWAGDPGRTHTLQCVRKYTTKAGAKRALTRARKYRPYKYAQVVLYNKI